MEIKLDSSIQQIINLLKNNGFKAYVVGGYLRDKLLGIATLDVDITTNAPPNKLKKIFNTYNVNDSFITMGCIKFSFDKYNFEITTFRKEYEYLNHRKPSKIQFINSLEEDLARRDFTINALCSDGVKFVDIYGGIDDLKSKEIKAIGDPLIRFNEDVLRVLRAIRFSSKLGFDLTYVDEAIKVNYKLLDLVSFEVKYNELKGILSGEYWINVLKKHREILKDAFSIEDLKIELFNERMDYEEREGLFFYFSDNKVKNRYLNNKNIHFNGSRVDLKKKLNKYGEKNIFDLLSFRNRVFNINSEEFEMLKDIIKRKECYNLKMLDINGNDLLNIEKEKNKIGKHLNVLLEAVIESKCLNEKKELLKYLKNNILD